MSDPTRITEIDIADPERDAVSQWFRCDECNDSCHGIDRFWAAWDICTRCAMAD